MFAVFLEAAAYSNTGTSRDCFCDAEHKSLGAAILHPPMRSQISAGIHRGGNQMNRAYEQGSHNPNQALVEAIQEQKKTLKRIEDKVSEMANDLQQVLKIAKSQQPVAG